MFAPLLLGLAGSLHCVGMCGPLVLALPLDAAGKRHVIGQMLLYHSGRILMYATLGILFGLLGKGIALAGFQKVLSITAGLLMIVMAFAAWRFEQLVARIPGFGTFSQRVKTQMGRMLRQNGAKALFTMGMLNGLLPCGMVYAALAGAIASFGGVEGGLFMLIFGVGTLPLLLAVSVLGRSFSVSVRQK
ncbi:MAG: sulfite exporter TauE/SafE family protein, partial [Bacteroidota bacterium]